MSAKIVKAHPLNAPHTAGIFSDMSIDGPEIGTLVLVVDRAKNLPNRKTIGKQDPYCAARLGKEAKKTTTDVRGGQTPRWDQELRFTVHDSPDYYQLKVSVFNDDKKTDLIGESWVDLHDIIVPGGGQNDLWHNLSYRGKYAGEIRVEITYYDTRPKLEKPLVKAKNPAELDPVGGQARMGPRRRPLPNEPSAAPSAQDFAAEPDQTPPWMQASYIPAQSPLQNLEYNTPQVSPARYLRQDDQTAGPANGAYDEAPHHLDLPSIDGPRQPRRDEQGYSAGYTPQQYEPQDSPYGYGLNSGMNPQVHELPPPPPLQMGQQVLPLEDDRPPPPPVHRNLINSGNSQEILQQQRSSFDLTGQKGTPPSMRHDVLRNEAHRHSVPAQQQPGRPTYKGYDSAPSAPQVSPPSNYAEGHHPSAPRHHSYDSAYDPGFRAMQPTVEDVPDSPTNAISAFRVSGSRRPQYHGADYGDDPSPAPLDLSGRSSALSGQYNGSIVSASSYRSQDGPDIAPSVSPLLGREYGHPRDLAGSSQSSYAPYSAQNTQQYPTHRSELDDIHVRNANADQYGLPAVPSSLVPGVDRALAQEISDRIYEERRSDRRRDPHMSTPPTVRPVNQQPQSYELGGGSPTAYGTPPQLQARHSRSPVAYSTGGGGGGDAAPSPPAIIKPRALSPNPNPSPTSQHTIKRKSISPAPPVDGRRLSGIPFAPDSYDALNPTVSAHKARPVRTDYSDSSGKIITHDGKEVDPTDHLPIESWAPEPEPRSNKPTTPSSRPSPVGAQPMPPSSGRRPPRSAARPHSMATPPQYISADPLGPDGTPSPPAASNGRNRLQKKANRMSALPMVPSSASSPARSSPLAPIPHPLQQDNYPPSPSQLPYPGSAGRSLPRSSTWDFQNENRAPLPAHRVAGGPPIPAKVPINSAPVMSGGLGGGGGGTGARGRRGGSEGGGGAGYSGYGGGYHGGGGGGGGGGEMDLMEEMRRIDIGTGRARRHGGGY